MIERLRQNSFLWYQGPFILWALLLFTQSSVPGDEIPDFGFFEHDKLIHFGIYVVLAIVVHRALRHQSKFPLLAKHHYLATILVVSLYGATDELHQYFVPNRSASVYDWIADTAGGIVFVAAHWVRKRVRATDQPSITRK